MPKVSVIIPVYQVEQFIERCARSLFEQTLDDIEYIFVNDCTTDSSIEILCSILDEYPNRKEQVHIIDMEHNSGQAAVRKRGIELATGDYIIHCDSDDFVDRNMYELMYECAVKGNHDIVVSDMYEGNDSDWKYRKGKTSSSSDMISDIFFFFLSSLWNKLIKNEIVHSNAILFPNHNTCEDLALVVQYVLLSDSIGYINKPLYYYFRRPTSILGDRSPQSMIRKNTQMVANLDIAVEAMSRNHLEEKYKDEILHERLWIKNQLLPVMPYVNCTKLWRNTYRQINSQVLFSAVFSFREKLNFVITYLGLYPFYYRLKNALR